jgi:hypothetical protein
MGQALKNPKRHSLIETANCEVLGDKAVFHLSLCPQNPSQLSGTSRNLSISIKLFTSSQGYWHMHLIPGHGKLRQEEREFEASLGYMIRLCLKNKAK